MVKRARSKLQASLMLYILMALQDCIIISSILLFKIVYIIAQVNVGCSHGLLTCPICSTCTAIAHLVVVTTRLNRRCGLLDAIMDMEEEEEEVPEDAVFAQPPPY